jgi:hypothetical protein
VEERQSVAGEDVAVVGSVRRLWQERVECGNYGGSRGRRELCEEEVTTRLRTATKRQARGVCVMAASERRGGGEDG